MKEIPHQIDVQAAADRITLVINGLSQQTQKKLNTIHQFLAEKQAKCFQSAPSGFHFLSYIQWTQLVKI